LTKRRLTARSRPFRETRHRDPSHLGSYAKSPLFGRRPERRSIGSGSRNATRSYWSGVRADAPPVPGRERRRTSRPAAVPICPITVAAAEPWSQCGTAISTLLRVGPSSRPTLKAPGRRPDTSRHDRLRPGRGAACPPLGVARRRRLAEDGPGVSVAPHRDPRRCPRCLGVGAPWKAAGAPAPRRARSSVRLAGFASRRSDPPGHASAREPHARSLRDT